MCTPASYNETRSCAEPAGRQQKAPAVCTRGPAFTAISSASARRLQSKRRKYCLNRLFSNVLYEFVGLEHTMRR